jgi:predicted PurR-regulated permease PerM
MKESFFKIALSLIGILLGAYCIYFFRSILGYLLISIALSFAGRPIVNGISKIKIKGKSLPTFVGAVAAILSFIIAAGVVLGLFGPLIAVQAETIGNLNPQEIAGDVKGWFTTLDNLRDKFNMGDQSVSSILIEQTQALIGINGVSSIFGGIINFVGNAFIAVFSILFMTFFFLKDGDLFHKIIIALTPEAHVDKIENIMASSSRLLTRYFSGLILQVSIVTFMVSTGLAITGAENALLLGFIAGIFNLVPYLGPLASTGIGLIIVATTYDGDTAGWAPHIAYAAIVYGVTQLADNFFTQPFLFSNRVNAHPLEIFIVISMAGAISGVSGMILAVPGYTLLRIIANEFLSGYKIVDALTDSIDDK